MYLSLTLIIQEESYEEILSKKNEIFFSIFPQKRDDSIITQMLDSQRGQLH